VWAAAGDDGGVDVVAELEAPCTPEVLFAEVDDLTGYPEWLNIVWRAVVEEAAAGAPDSEIAWIVDLRGRLGPLARSKRLRMVRTVSDRPTHVRFERRETHGRSSSPWVLDARVEPTANGSRLTMHLHYGGSFGAGILERMLTDEIERSRPRLRARVAAAADPPR
jgi:hypothetical protein